ncbi:MAG: DUF2314 domain-containing protein [Bacteroidia bacterium]|nr:DUF2314 domain-containing protein [Bacteroidia bacterium]
MKQFILATLILIGLISCSNNPTTKVEREGEPAIYNVEDKDAEMNEAIKTANKTIDEFRKALESNNPDFDYFSIKMRFNAPPGGEHIWLTDITFKNNKFYGVVNNEPEITTEVKLGDSLEIVNDRISDWMYQDNDTLRGGYTIRAIRNKLSDAEKKQFDVENGLLIKD